MVFELERVRPQVFKHILIDVEMTYLSRSVLPVYFIFIFADEFRFVME